MGKSEPIPTLDLDRYVPGLLVWVSNKLSASASQLYRRLFDLGVTDWRVLAYIELFNFRHKMNTVERVKYIRAQLRAVREVQAEGWLAWSAGNHYDLLFEILRQFKDEAAG